MSEIQDWVWLIVAVLWVALRVLPRLFRRAKGGPEAVKTPEQRHKRHEELDAAELEGPGGAAPPPIVPR